ncbi:hypothetical protein [Chryseobacterium sp. GP-SGM7]|uniref:hypothetical protein n=1 Tax=Chryseobacterium sp. GP-SGM7 TaxID=3411323 RepID=UPI003B9308AE
MRKILIFILGSFTVLLHAQGNIGVATTSPRANLDVNGDLNIGKKIFLDNGSGVLLAGNEDQLLVSRGPNNPPTWKTLRIPEYLAGKYYLIFNDSFRDFNTVTPGGTTGQGISFNNSETAPTTLVPSTDFVVDTPLSSLTAKGFKTISGLSKDFTVNSTVSSTYFMFETVVQQNNAGGNASNIKFACGIFVDGLLKSIRLNMLPQSASNNTFITHTQIGGVENMAAGTHTINVACARLTNPFAGLTLGVGSPSYQGTQNTNNFMTQSSLKVDVYEIPQNFSSVIIP